jgi:hypothetical protein
VKIVVHVGKHGKISPEMRGHVVAWVPQEGNPVMPRHPRSMFGRNVTEAIEDMRAELARCNLDQAEIEWVDTGSISGGVSHGAGHSQA